MISWTRGTLSLLRTKCLISTLISSTSKMTKVSNSVLRWNLFSLTDSLTSSQTIRKPFATLLGSCLSSMRGEFTWTSSKWILNTSTPLLKLRGNSLTLTMRMSRNQLPKDRRPTSRSPVALTERLKSLMSSSNTAKTVPLRWHRSFVSISWEQALMSMLKMGS